MDTACDTCTALQLKPGAHLAPGTQLDCRPCILNASLGNPHKKSAIRNGCLQHSCPEQFSQPTGWEPSCGTTGCNRHWLSTNVKRDVAHPHHQQQQSCSAYWGQGLTPKLVVHSSLELHPRLVGWQFSFTQAVCTPRVRSTHYVACISWICTTEALQYCGHYACHC